MLTLYHIRRLLSADDLSFYLSVGTLVEAGGVISAGQLRRLREIEKRLAEAERRTNGIPHTDD